MSKKMVNPNNVENIIDLCIKTFIAVAVSVAGFHMKRVGDDIDALQEKTALHQTNISLLQAAATNVDLRLTRMEQKLDNLLMEIKRR